MVKGFMLKMYPFPIFRNVRTDPDLTKLVLSFLEQTDLKVTRSSDDYYGYLTTKEGTLTFWNKNYPYAYANQRVFRDRAGVVKEWWGCMPSRYAVLKLKKAMDKTVRPMSKGVYE
jgi:hypothetical protein